MRQRSDANSSGLDHNEIAKELFRVSGHDFDHRISLRRGREAIQFQQDHPANPVTLANHQFAEIAILP